jgi:hypothetical protein
VRIDYYVYYRVRTGQDGELMAALSAMQTALARTTGVNGRFRRRVDDPLTWMEVYEDVSDPRLFEVELGLQALRHGLHEFLAAGTARHLERFRALG